MGSPFQSHQRHFYRFAVLVALFSLLVSPIAVCSDVLILAPIEAEPEHRVLQASIDSQLMDYNLSSELQLLDEPLPDTQPPIEIARQYQMLTHKPAILWIQGDSFFLYIHDGEDSHFFSRPLPGQSSSWELQCDAIASVVHAVVSSWMEPMDSESNPSVTPPAQNDPQDTQPIEATVPEDTRNDESSLFPDSRPYRLECGMMYTAYIMSSNNPWVNGVAGMLNVRFGPHLMAGLDAGFAATSGDAYRMTRVPLRIKFGARLEKNRYFVEADAALYVDVTRIRTDRSERLSKADTRYIGIGLISMAGIRLRRRISLFAMAGLDISSSSNIYWHNDSAVFYYGAIQGRIGAGIIFHF